MGGKNSVLLQTATANVSNPRDGMTVQARLIFNSGSQRSYISTGLRSSLEHPSLRSETVSSDAATHVHYLPHREVVRSDKETTKLRIVFDASAKRDGPSLNDCVHAGPPLSPLPMDITMRFRCYQIALVGDIEKAFLMVGVKEADRDVLRFLWVKDPFASEPKVEINRFTRLVFGVSSSPFLLNATLQHHMSKYALSDPEFVKKFLEVLYVDDLSTGDRNVEETYQLFLKSKLENVRGWFQHEEMVIQFKGAD